MRLACVVLCWFCSMVSSIYARKFNVYFSSQDDKWRHHIGGVVVVIERTNDNVVHLYHIDTADRMFNFRVSVSFADSRHLVTFDYIHSK